MKITFRVCVAFILQISRLSMLLNFQSPLLLRSFRLEPFILFIYEKKKTGVRLDLYFLLIYHLVSPTSRAWVGQWSKQKKMANLSHWTITMLLELWLLPSHSKITAGRAAERGGLQPLGFYSIQTRSVPRASSASIREITTHPLTELGLKNSLCHHSGT